MATLSLSDFRLSQAVLEARYLNGFLHWDRAGAIWMEMTTKHYPALKMVKAEPGQSMFRLEDRYELGVQVDKLSVHAHNPHSTLKEFSEIADQFGSTVLRFLELEEYTRIGFRVIYLKEFDDPASAADALLSTGRLSLPSAQSFGVNGAPVSPAFSCRWDGQAKGFTVQLRTEERKYAFDRPFAWEGEKFEGKERHLFVLDIDYYTTATIGTAQVRLSDWVQQAIHLVRRDTDNFLRP
jgi:uncharacterized protein (TIGR04255 family)